MPVCKPRPVADAGRWLRIRATDVAPGDVIRVDGEGEHRVISRDYPDVTSLVFHARFPGGVRPIGKLTRLDVWDEDGTVAARVRVIIDWRRH